MNWKSKKTKTGIETYEINYNGKYIYINKNPKKDTDYWCQILYEGFGENTFWASGEADIKVRLVRRKVPKEIIDNFKIIP